MNERQMNFVENLYREMYDRLTSYALNALRDPARAEDIVQSTFELVCLNVNTLMNHESPRGWVLVTFRNLLRTSAKERVGDIMLLERLQSRLLIEQDKEWEDLDPDILYGNLLENEDYRLLREFVNSESTIVEFSGKHGISVEACKKRLQRARSRLRRYFRKM